MTTQEQVIGEPNQAQIMFRVPESMKKDAKLLCKFAQYSSMGELMRTLFRHYREETYGSAAFRLWLQLQKDFEDVKIEKVREQAKKLGFELRKIDQRNLE